MNKIRPYSLPCFIFLPPPWLSSVPGMAIPFLRNLVCHLVSLPHRVLLSDCHHLARSSRKASRQDKVVARLPHVLICHGQHHCDLLPVSLVSGRTSLLSESLDEGGLLPAFLLIEFAHGLTLKQLFGIEDGIGLLWLVVSCIFWLTLLDLLCFFGLFGLVIE